MRATFLLSLALVSVGVGCRCDERVSSVGAELVVTQPTVKDGEEWLLEVGAAQVGASRTGLIVVENHGKADATVKSIALRPGSDPAFTLEGADAPRGVAAGAGLTVTVRYTPTALASATGTVDIATTDPKLPTVAVRLTAVGQAASLEVCVEDASGAWACNTTLEIGGLEIDFGSVLVGSLPLSRQVRVRNIGTLPLSYLGTALVDPSSLEFSLNPTQDTPAGGNAMDVGAELQFAVGFDPVVAGLATGTAEVTTLGGVTPTVDIALRGVAAESLVCHLSVRPARLDFGNLVTGTTAEQVVTVQNAGTQDCTVSGLPLTGSGAFTAPSAPALPYAMAPGSSFSMRVRYAPTAVASHTGTLTVQSDDPASPALAVPLTGAGITQPDCVVTATPASLHFGGVVPGDREARSVTLTASGAGGLCTVISARLAQGNTAFLPAGTFPMVLFGGGFGGFGSGSLGVTYAPTVSRADNDTLLVGYTAGFGGPTLTTNIPLSGHSGQRRLCITPARLHYGAVAVGTPASRSFTMTACGSSAVNVTQVTVEPGGTPFTLAPAPALPLALPRTASAAQPVQVLLTSGAGARARVHVVSDDPVFPDQYVDLDVGAELVPPEAGEVLYSWTAGAFSSGGAMEGTIYRTYLQGPPNRTAYYGTQAGQSCSGCHAVSPDGRYVALLEYNTSPIMRIVDARTGGAIPLPGTANGQFPAWRPDVNTTPAYQFVFNDGNVLKTASVVAGILGEVQGANDPTKVQTQPSWGPNGKIAFVRGNPDADAGTFAINGPADLMVVPESGGTATAVPGASGNGGGNYYPEFSPNGKYLAFTFSPAGQTTRAAPDSVIRLVEVQSGALSTLPQLNAAGPNSWPTWARNGQFLSFSSMRSGGQGSADIYFAPVDQNTGVDGPAQPVSSVNTGNYDHVARWAFLPP